MKTVSTFCHTHWDYEWYFSENESLIQLIYHMDEIIEFLNQNQNQVYVLDGQMAILEDFLQYSPDKYSKIQKLVQQGKLIIGPWYSQTDELIISGESIVRNLFYGIQSANRFGKYMNVGYLPDSFGQAKNMPKIFKGFDIPYSIFWRGVDCNQVDQREFNWNSDGQEVLVYNIKNGYFFGGEVWMEQPIENVNKVEQIFMKKCTSDKVLLPIGSDQRKLDMDFVQKLQEYNGTSKNCRYIVQSPESFMEELSKERNQFPVIEGEFISSMDSKIHHSIYSMRYDHKYLHDKVERRLIHVVEPLAVMLGYDELPIKHDALKECWKVLMRSQAHDSACGCNSDKTNSIILSRLEKADQLSYSLLDYMIRKYAESRNDIEDGSILLCNTIGQSRIKEIRLLVNTKKKGFKLLLNGKNLNYKVTHRERVYSGVFGNDSSKYDSELYYYQTTVLMEMEFKPYEKVVLDVIETDEEKLECLSCETDFIENDVFKLSYSDGKLNLYSKLKNEIINNWLTIVDDGDDGDSYDYSPQKNPKVMQCKFNNAEIKTYPELKKMTLSGVWDLPADLNNRNYDKEKVSVPYILKLKLNQYRVDVHLELDNKADSHRMRVHLKSLTCSENSISDTAFGLIERPCNPQIMENWQENGYREEPTPIYPMLNLCGLCDKDTCTLVFSKGIKEYEILNNQIIALTLFRSVGVLGKADLIRRPGGPSGNQFKVISTPDAQLHKSLKFKFSYMISEKNNDADILKFNKDYITGIVYYQKQEINRFTTTLQYFKINPLNRIANNSFDIKLNNNDFIISSLVPVREECFAIRLVNFSDKKDSVTVRLPSKVNKAYVTNMKYDILEELDICNSNVCLHVNGKNIITLLCEY